VTRDHERGRQRLEHRSHVIEISVGAGSHDEQISVTSPGRASADRSIDQVGRLQSRGQVLGGLDSNGARQNNASIRGQGLFDPRWSEQGHLGLVMVTHTDQDDPCAMGGLGRRPVDVDPGSTRGLGPLSLGLESRDGEASVDQPLSHR
jgi:hypothetical protein